MRLPKFLRRKPKPRPMTVFYLSDENDIGEEFSFRGHKVRFFSYKPFYPDNLIGMYARINMMLEQSPPDLILLNLKEDQMINDRESEMLNKYAVVLTLANG